MPHDRFGEELRDGDVVLLRCRVKSIQPGEKPGHVTVEAIDGPEGEDRPTVSCDQQLLRKLPAGTPGGSPA